MQLKKPQSIRGALALATYSVVTAVPAAHAQEPAAPWEFDSALLYYAEKDRVTAIEPVIRARKKLGDEEFLSLRLVIDSLTGASPNGAIPTNSVQTFTTPSGDRTYTAPANETPLDTSFLDTRYALNAEWEKPLSENLRGVFSLNGSTEYDYTSTGAAATLARDFNQRNTTLTAGVSYNADSVDPVGGAPVGLTAAPTAAPANKPTLGTGLSKNVTEVLLGVTQVINRRTLMQFNLGYGQDDGYLTDPYKILSVVDGVTGDLRGSDPYLYEKRPDQRTRQTFYWKTQHQFTRDVITGVYRYYTDDWGVTSHTADLRYRWEMAGGNYWQPHVRYYTQGAADFYRHSLVAGETPQYASADYRLGEMSTTTFGLKYGIPLANNHEFALRAEAMQQRGDEHPANAVGSQRNQNLFPGTDALIFQVSYSFAFK